MVNKTKRKIGNIYTPVSEGFWIVEGVKDKGKTANYRIFEKMALAMNPDDLINYSIKEKEKGNPYLGSAPLNMALFSRAEELSHKNIEGIDSLRNFFRRGLEKFPYTLSRAVYNPQGEIDKAVHNYGTSDEYVLEENLVGKDGWIKDISDKEVLTAIFGTEDIKKINEVFQWINQTNAYLWRLNSKPSKRDERVVGFDASPGRLLLDCLWDPAIRYPAFRVLKVN